MDREAYALQVAKMRDEKQFIAGDFIDLELIIGNTNEGEVPCTWAKGDEWAHKFSVFVKWRDEDIDSNKLIEKVHFKMPKSIGLNATVRPNEDRKFQI